MAFPERSKSEGVVVKRTRLVWPLSPEQSRPPAHLEWSAATLQASEGWHKPMLWASKSRDREGRGAAFVSPVPGEVLGAGAGGIGRGRGK